MSLRYLICFLLLCNLSYADGLICLIGGGTAPPKAISWIKERSADGKNLVVSCDTEKNERWINLIGDCTYILPEELTIKSLDGTAKLIFEGGDQWQYLQRLDGKVVQKAHEDGIQIIATSASAMLLGAKYFSAEKGTVSSDNLDPELICIGSKFVNFKCLEDTIIESHYYERNRRGRLKAFMEKATIGTGIGIDEGTALVIYGETRKVFGLGNVEFIYKGE